MAIPVLQRGQRKFGLGDQGGYSLLNPAWDIPDIWWWYRAEDISASNGALFNTWQGYRGHPQTSASAYILTNSHGSTYYPTYFTGSFGTYPSAYFAGSGRKFLNYNSSYNQGIQLGSSGYTWTIVFFGRLVPQNWNGCIFCGAGQSNFMAGIYNSQSFATYEGNWSFLRFDYNYPYTSSTHMWVMSKVDPNNVACYYDGYLIGYLPYTYMRVDSFCNWYGVNYDYAWQGHLGEAIFYNRGITSAEIWNLRDYFKTKYMGDPLLGF